MHGRVTKVIKTHYKGRAVTLREHTRRVKRAPRTVLGRRSAYDRYTTWTYQIGSGLQHGWSPYRDVVVREAMATIDRWEAGKHGERRQSKRHGNAQLRLYRGYAYEIHYNRNTKKYGYKTHGAGTSPAVFYSMTEAKDMAKAAIDRAADGETR